MPDPAPGNDGTPDIERTTDLTSLDRTTDASAIDRTVATDHPGATPVPEVRHGLIRPEPPEHVAGDQIGAYRLTQQIGQGSFGTVWIAERVQGGFKQVVAMKLTRASAGSRLQLQRFQFERETLANLDHPGIARVFDGGDAGQGALYYVMELVRGGKPITAFCDEKRLSIQDRLRLFTQACEALAYAHKQGVMHRDLSPNNILAFEDESLPVGTPRHRVKLIDFGLAKPVASTALKDSPGTEAAGTPIGTLAYASPEQIRGDPTTGTRSDVYALGAVLYELLVGTPPVNKDDLPTGRSRDQLLQHISQSEPPSPSDRISKLLSSGTMPREKMEALARARRTALDRLALELREELNWLPMKALERLPDERYQSADELAADVRNYLELRPLRAHPRTLGYVARKFVRRNRGKVALASVLAVALVVSVVTIVFLYVEADRQRARAERSLQEQKLVSAFQRSMLAELDAESEGKAWRAWLVQRLSQRLGDAGASLPEAERARRIAEFEGDMQALNTTDAASAFLGQVVDGSVPVIEAKFKDMPQVRADLLQAVVQIKLGLGQQSDASLWPLQKKVLELREQDAKNRPADLHDAQHWCAEVKRLQGSPEAIVEAREFARLSLQGRESLVERDPAAVAGSLILLANLVPSDEAIAALRRVQDGAEFPGWLRLRAAISLGATLADAGRLEEAQQVLEAARATFADSLQDRAAAADLCNNLGFVLDRSASSLPSGQRSARKQEALKRYEEALALHSQLHGDDHSITIDTRNNVALALMSLGSPEASARARELIDVNGRHVRANRPPEEMVQAFNTLSKALLDGGQIDDALRLSEQVWDGACKFYAPGCEQMVRTGKMRAAILLAGRRPGEAEALLSKVLDERFAWMARHGQRGYDRFALDAAGDLMRVLVDQRAFDRLPAVFGACDATAAAGDDVKNDGKFNYLTNKVDALVAWAKVDAAKAADAQAAQVERARVAKLRTAAGKAD